MEYNREKALGIVNKYFPKEHKILNWSDIMETILDNLDNINTDKLEKFLESQINK